MSNKYYSRHCESFIDLLVCGFIRKINELSIPIVLYKLCYAFYNEAIHWKIKDNELTKFFKCKPFEPLLGPIFSINNVSFQLNSFAKGNYDDHTNYVQLYLYFLKNEFTEHNINEFSIIMTLFCDETKYIFRHPLIFSNERWSFNWYPFHIIFDKIKKYKQINFGCAVEILYIKYNKNKKNKLINYIKTINMNINSKFKWILNEYELDRIISGTAVYSLNRFNNNCFCVVIVPDIVINNKELIPFHVFIKLQQLPFGVLNIEINYKITMILKSKIKEWNDYNIYYDYDKTGSKTTKTPVDIKQTDFKNGLTIMAEVTITKVRGANGLEIPKLNWNEYGITVC